MKVAFYAKGKFQKLKNMTDIYVFLRLFPWQTSGISVNPLKWKYSNNINIVYNLMGLKSLKWYSFLLSLGKLYYFKWFALRETIMSIRYLIQNAAGPYSITWLSYSAHTLSLISSMQIQSSSHHLSVIHSLQNWEAVPCHPCEHSCSLGH